MFARGDLPSVQSVQGLLEEIFCSTHAGVGADLKFSHYTQTRDYDIRDIPLKNIYAQLELTYNLIRATTPIYTKYSYTAGPSYDSTTSRDQSPAAIAVRGFAKKAAKLHHIDIDAASSRYGLERAQLIRKLNDWNESRVIDLKPSGVLSVYKVTRKVPDKVEIKSLAQEIYSTMKKREEEALQRTNDMLELITAKACFSKSLAQHFGDDIGKEECGHCTWCMTHKAIVQQLPPPVELNQDALKAILARVPARDDARFLARVAFGISSPRATTLKLSKDPVFGSMADHDFSVRLARYIYSRRDAN